MNIAVDGAYAEILRSIRPLQPCGSVHLEREGNRVAIKLETVYGFRGFVVELASERQAQELIKLLNAGSFSG